LAADHLPIEEQSQQRGIDDAITDPHGPGLASKEDDMIRKDDTGRVDLRQ
jgi:hypothetical protein